MKRVWDDAAATVATANERMARAVDKDDEAEPRRGREIRGRHDRDEVMSSDACSQIRISYMALLLEVLEPPVVIVYSGSRSMAPTRA